MGEPSADELSLESRQRILDAIVRQQPRAYEISGAWGTGKSWLLHKLGNALGASGVEVVRLGIPAEPDVPAGQYPHPLVEFRQCLTFASEIAVQRRGRGDRRLERAVDALARKATFRPFHVDQSIRATGNAVVYAEGAQTVQLAWADHLTGLARILATDVSDAFARRRGSRLALLVDDFHHVRSPGPANWLLEVTRRLPDAVVVIARQRAVRSGALGPEFQRYTLDALTDQEVKQYLTYRFGEPPSEARLRLVSAVTGRLPWAVALVANSMGRVPEAERELARLLALPDVTWRVADLLDVLLSYRDPAFRQSLARLSVLRGFDWQLADHMLTPIMSAGATTVDTLAELRHALLLESAGTSEEPPARAHSPGSPRERLRIPDLVAASIADGVRERNPLRHAELHRHAAAGYWARITESLDDGDPESQFAYWSRFENLTWPRQLAEWIHHMAHSADADHDRVRVLVTRWYLEGFFWYEWFVPHWFCERLLDACQDLRAGGGDLAWLDCLHAVHANFPRGWRHEATARAWRATTDAFLKIRLDAAPAGYQPPAHPTSASQTYALATHLLADALQFQGGNTAIASRYYDEARAWYVGARNAWERTHTELDQADLWLGAGDGRLAAERLPRIERAAREVRDAEMLTCVFRVHADRCWAEGDHQAAMAGYLKAALHAFWYQVQQIDLPSASHFPDRYTRERYEEMTARANARIDQLRDGGHRDLSGRVERACRELFGPFWERSGQAATGIFPPAPQDADLGQEHSDYLRHARWTVAQRHALLRLNVTDDLVAPFLGSEPVPEPPPSRAGISVTVLPGDTPYPEAMQGGGGADSSAISDDDNASPGAGVPH